MKKIELNSVGRSVLIILIWLLSFTVVTNAATITGTTFIGAFAFYVGALFLAFFYFKDEELMKNAKKSLIVVVIFAILFIAIQCYTDILIAINVDVFKGAEKTIAYKTADVLNGIAIIFRNVVMVFCLLKVVLNTFSSNNNTKALEQKQDESE